MSPLSIKLNIMRHTTSNYLLNVIYVPSTTATAKKQPKKRRSFSFSRLYSNSLAYHQKGPGFLRIFYCCCFCLCPLTAPSATIIARASHLCRRPPQTTVIVILTQKVQSIQKKAKKG
eukprot:gene12949-8805_t